MHPLPLVDGCMLFDNSFFSTQQDCPYALWNGRILKRELGASRPGLIFGGIGHKVLELRYRQLGSDLPDLSFEDKQIQLINDIYNPGLGTGDAATPLFPVDDWRTANWAIELFVKRYNAKYQIEPFNILFDKDHMPLVEVPFMVPLMTHCLKDGRPIPCMHIGRIDMAIEQDYHIFVVDHKTTSMLGENVMNEMRSSDQFPGYIRGFFHATGIQPIGFIVNYLRTREAPMKPKGGIDTWWDENFYRQTEFVQPNRIAEWEQSAFQQVEEFFWRWENDRFTQHRKSCVTKYGKCQYYELCSLPHSQHAEMLSSSQYTDNNWSPLEHN